MVFNIYNFISEDCYRAVCKSLKDREIKVIYSDDIIDIEIKKVGRKILTFVNT